ncbi:MAG: sn-glycerol-3-phosphate ABC transporter permease UgpE, partial [Pseudomonadota bacterium]
MVEDRPFLTLLSHMTLVVGAALVIFPVYIAFVASTHPTEDFLSGVVPLVPGDHLVPTYRQILTEGMSVAGTPPVWLMLTNSLVMAMGIAVGKIIISVMSAYAVVYFRFPFRMLAFWLIFITLMLPVEVRILPTFEVVAGLQLLNSYTGLILPLIASATATFLFRQFFLTVPDELLEAARVDGAGPIRFLIDILLPLSRTNIAALFVILFIYGWNQYLWPLLVTADESYYTIVMGIQRLANVNDQQPHWNIIMGTATLALVPPVIVDVGEPLNAHDDRVIALIGGDEQRPE